MRYGHPLSGVVGLAQFMSQAAGVPQSLSSQLGVLKRAAENALSQIDELTNPTLANLSTSQSTETSVDIRTLVQDVAALWSARAGQSLSKLSVKVAKETPPAIVVNAEKVRQCLNALLSNAVDRTSRGHVSVGCGVSQTEAGSCLLIAVRDICPQSTQRDQSGLVAYDRVVERLVSDMDGKLEVHTASGNAVTVTMAVPITVEDSEHDSSSSLVDTLMSRQRAPDASPYAGLRILAVDDNAINGQVIEQLLQGRVEAVVLASNGRKALEQLEADRFDLVLMDIHMPVMDGIEATLAIRGARKPYSDIPIVALTADSDYQQKRVAVNLGMDAAIAKPVTLSKLLQVFEELGLSRMEQRAA